MHGGAVQRRGPLVYDGKIVASTKAVTDGPFVESKEAIAGYLIIHADSLEQATEIAKGCPGLEIGQTVEVRAIGPEPSELVRARKKVTDQRKEG